ncbi:hypothetical protein KQX54_005016 [Cotesia glomerata]|uniref:Uncharacterized protein n=1 Tax=Cotesia glomerata TaxID=32391 RepID=A0AAV7ICX6_COTGL|nr:hypothetical protein KQX54_005016 [Cotesia glomerata]
MFLETKQPCSLSGVNRVSCWILAQCQPDGGYKNSYWGAESERGGWSIGCRAVIADISFQQGSQFLGYKSAPRQPLPGHCPRSLSRFESENFPKSFTNTGHVCLEPQPFGFISSYQEFPVRFPFRHLQRLNFSLWAPISRDCHRSSKLKAEINRKTVCR